MGKINNFFKKKRIIITGHNGFKGTWLSLLLKELGSSIFGISLKDNKKSIYHLIKRKQFFDKEFEIDIRNFNKLNNTIKNIKPDIIFHLAAQPFVNYSYDNPVETFSTNVMGSCNILESCYKNKIKNLIYITSDKSYKNKEWIHGYRENDELGGFDPYSASKASSEILFNSYLKSFYEKQSKVSSDIFINSARAGNVIGGGDFNYDRLVPYTIKNIFENKTIYLRYPQAVRPWQHVLDPLYGYLKLAYYAETKKESSVWNFGPELNNFRVIDAVKLMLRITKNKNKISYAKNFNHETLLLHLNSDKSRAFLKWKPVWDIKNTFNKTMTWYDCYYKNNHISKLTLDQIGEYLDAAN